MQLFFSLLVGRFFHIAFKSAGCVAAAAMVVVVVVEGHGLSENVWYVLFHASEHMCACACAVHPIPNFFPASLPLLPPSRPLLTDCFHTSIVCQLPASVYWNIFPQRSDFRADEAQLVCVCGSNPLPNSRNRMGTEWEVGGGLARRLALLRRSTAAEAVPAPPAPTWPWMQSICLLLDLRR